ncbi:hypothetical protein C8F01DRAFT_1342702 [Mycena amicta]|nr:hypothetical protein C8F01DRAFT_1342702 [Mycena amicta]
MASSSSRKGKRRAQQMEDLQEQHTQTFRKPFTEQVHYTVTTAAGATTTSSELPAEPAPSAPPLPPIGTMEDDDEIHEMTPKVTRRAQLLQDFEDHFEEISDSLLEFETDAAAGSPCACGRAGCLATVHCRDCIGYKIACDECFIEAHWYNPFHWAEVWDVSRGFFVRNDVSKLGFVFQLAHNGGVCPSPAAGRLFTVVDANGVHSTRLAFCGCREQPPNKVRQLLRSGLFPASTREPLTAFTLNVLKHFQLHNFGSKKAAYDYVKALRRLSDNSFTADVPNPYAAFLRVVRIYNFLTLKKRTGQLHGIDDVLGHRPSGNLLVWCPACPQPGFNSDPNCRSTPTALRHLNQVQRTLDGNFQCNQFNKNTDPDDVSLCAGKGYFPPDDKYRAFLATIPLSKEKSTCNYLSVVNKQDKKKFKNMAITGTINVQCSHVYILATVDLHHGERYANADAALALELSKWCPSEEFEITLKLEIDDVEQVKTYDIACEYVIYLHDRFAKHFPELVHLVDRIRWGIPALHVQGHQERCMYLFGTAYMDCIGHFHGESAEQYWPEANQLGPHVRQMNHGHRQDTLINHHGDWNWKKTMALAATLSDNLALAKTNYATKRAHLIGLSATFRDRLVEWRSQPRTSSKVGKDVVSVYKHNSTKVPSQQAIFQKLIKDDDVFARTIISKGRIANFMDEGLKIEESQRQLGALILDRTEHDLVARQREVTSRTTKLQTKMIAWRKTQKLIMPTVGDAVAAQSLLSLPVQDEKLYLPSNFLTREERTALALDDLADEEARWREGQVFDSLRALQNNVKAITALQRDKMKNDRHQKQNTRSGGQIREGLRRRELHKSSYHVARSALLTLNGVTSFPELQDADLYMKPVLDKRRLGDSKLSDGALWTALPPSNIDEEDGDAMEIEPTASAESPLPSAAAQSSTSRSGTQMDRRRPTTGRRPQTTKPDAKSLQDDRPSGWIWQLGKLTKMTETEMDAWSREGDRVQWFCAEAEMMRWREQKELKLAELLRTRRSFIEMAETWTKLGSRAEKPGYAAYALQKAAMYSRMASDTADYISTAGHTDLLAEGANLVEWVEGQRAEEDLSFDKLVYTSEE